MGLYTNKLDDTFCFHVSLRLDDDCDPTIVAKAHSQSDWSIWEEAMKSKLKSLKSRKVFSPLESTPKSVNPMGCNCCL